MTRLELQPHIRLNHRDPRYRGFITISPDSWLKSLFFPQEVKEVRKIPDLSEHRCHWCAYLVRDTRSKATHLLIVGYRNGGTTESWAADLSPNIHSWDRYTLCSVDATNIEWVDVETLQQLNPHAPKMTIHQVWKTQTCPKNEFQKK